MSDPLPAAFPARPPYRLLFVCMGNICRSPAAEGVMRHLAAAAGRENDIRCDSAGTIGHHAGNPADPRMRAAASRRGIELDGRARQLAAEDFQRFDLILTMDHENYAEAVGRAPDPAAAARVVPLMRFARARDAGAVVPDPYYGGAAGFERVLDLLGDACAGLLERLPRAA
jgi:protein-tyrosine phosphatase